MTAAKFNVLKRLGFGNRRRGDNAARAQALEEAHLLELRLDARNRHLPNGWPDDQEALELRRQIFELREPRAAVGWESRSPERGHRAGRASSILSTTAELRLLAKDAVPEIAAAAKATLAARKTTPS